MSFFAVLDAENFDERSNFEVQRLHLNLWSLAAVGVHRRMFVLDVGMNITATRKQVSEITLALPFDTQRPESLHDKVLDRKLAGLIFDRQISFNGEQVRYGKTTLNALEAATKTAEKSAAYTDRGFSLWTIPLTRPIRPGKSAYVRIRFPIIDTGRTWRWTKSRLMRNGALFDFRISDIRSSKKIDGGSQLLDRIRPINSVAAFVMAPVWLRGTTLHPEPRYIRLLEGKVWADYLNRSPELSQRSRLVVYYWKNAEDGPVTAENPMRVFAQFRIQSRPSALRAALVAGVVFALGAWLLFGIPVRPEILTWISDVWNGFVDFLLPDGFPVALTAAIAIALIAVAVQIFGWTSSIRRWVRDKFHAFEEWLFHFLRHAGPRD